MVAVSGSAGAPRVLDRRRLELVPPVLPRQPYHAVAEEGLDPTVIAEVEAAARESARAALASVPEAVAVGVVAAPRSLPDTLADILRVHARLHAAEGLLYEDAVIGAANRSGIAVHATPPEGISVSAAVDSLRVSIGAPWQKDHKWAASAGLAALRSWETRGARRP